MSAANHACVTRDTHVEERVTQVSHRVGSGRVGSGRVGTGRVGRGRGALTPVSEHPLERQSLLSHDPADLIASLDDAAENVRRLVAWMRSGWMAEAACTSHPLRLFFPGVGEPWQPAVEICSRCPVRVDCLEEALADSSLDHGIRGGMTARARARERQLRIAAGTEQSSAPPLPPPAADENES